MRICYKTSFTDENWKGLKTVVLIQTIVQDKVIDKLTNTVVFKETFSQSYFISSQGESARYYLDLKRKHWSIEVFHYTKDITYKEDSTKCNKGKSPQNNSCLRSLAISIYKSIGSTNQAQSIRLFGNRINKLFKIIQSF
jgi:predicted transposase YbfD/YdcC